MDDCPKCGGYMKLIEKDTFSGREFREYKCDQCGYSEVEDRGKALWQILADAREEAEVEGAAQASTPASESAELAEQHVSLWQRFLAIFSRSRAR